MVSDGGSIFRSCAEMNSQFSRYLLVGAFNTIVGYVIIFGAMYVLEWSPIQSNVFGYSIALMFSFLLNRNFTFRSTGRKSTELIRFLIVFAISFGANLVALSVLVEVFNAHKYLSQIFAGIVYVVISYAMNKYLVFRSGSV